MGVYINFEKIGRADLAPLIPFEKLRWVNWPPYVLHKTPSPMGLMEYGFGVQKSHFPGVFKFSVNFQ